MGVLLKGKRYQVKNINNDMDRKLNCNGMEARREERRKEKEEWETLYYQNLQR